MRGDALRLGSKGRYGLFRVWIKWINVWQVKLCDPSLTRAIPERLGDESAGMIKHYTKRHFTYIPDLFAGYFLCLGKFAPQKSCLG